MRTPPLWRAIAGICWIPMCYLSLPELLRLVIPDDRMLNYAFFTVNFAVTFALYFPFLRDSAKATGCGGKRLLRVYAVGLAIHYGGAALLALFLHAASVPLREILDGTVASLVRQDPLPMLVFTVIAVPITEELLFRGALFGLLRRENRLAAYAVTSALFAFVHVLPALVAGETARLPSALLYLPAAVALCFVYEATGTIRTSVLLHAAINAVSYVLVFVL